MTISLLIAGLLSVCLFDSVSFKYDVFQGKTIVVLSEYLAHLHTLLFTCSELLITFKVEHPQYLSECSSLQ